MKSFTGIKVNENIYKLIGSNGKEIQVSIPKLKSLIKLDKVNIVNLILTSDDKLIDNPKYQLNSIEAKAKIVNARISKVSTPNKEILIVNTGNAVSINTLNNNNLDIHNFAVSDDLVTHDDCLVIKSACEHEYYLVKHPNNDTSAILYIPDDVTDIMDNNIAQQVLNHTYILDQNTRYRYCDFAEHLIVIGGSGLICAAYMFANCLAQSLDLSELNTSKVKNAKAMFRRCRVRHLDLSNLDTSSITDMSHMFNGVYTSYLDLKSFKTPNVTNMSHMFANTILRKLDINSFKTPRLRNADKMFYNCRTSVINMKNITTNSYTVITDIFAKCVCKDIHTNDKFIHKQALGTIPGVRLI